MVTCVTVPSIRGGMGIPKYMDPYDTSLFSSRYEWEEQDADSQEIDGVNQ